MSQLKGGGGKPKTPPSPVNTPDNLRSADTVEMVLGLGMGPIKGLSKGHKRFYVGDTALQRQDDGYNFSDFDLKIYPGDHDPEMIKFRLGGESSNNQVGVSLAANVPVTRQTTHGNIDAIDIRMVVSALYKQVQEGKKPGVFDHTYRFRIRYKPVSSTSWGDWTDAGAFTTPNNPYVPEWDTSWSPDSYQDGNGNWHDPHQARVWSDSIWNDSLNWYHSGGYPPIYGNLTITGKTTSTYVKEYRIPVKRIPEPYQIEIMQLSPDSSIGGDPQYINEVTWESFQTIDNTPKFYPNVALAQVVAKSTDQFSSIPSMWGEYDGLIVRLPSNYDPYTNEYDGLWDGTWKYDWTNNPVWILYEAIHNTEWGWSAYTPVNWSKYEAYELAQICDYKLPSGKPRYTFNAYITEPMDGREFCRYIAGSFNSIITDDNNGNVRILMDKDDPAVAIVGPESIIGDFEYTYTDVNTRFNDMTVVFANPEIDYNEDRRRIHHQDQIDQFGRIPFDFVAVGCTDENEAVRKATRRMISATTETEMVSFRTTRLASYWDNYEVILITDPIKGYGLSGRFKSFSGSDVTLRDPIYLEVGVAYALEIQGLEGIVSRNVITPDVTGWVSTLKLASPLNSTTVGQKAQFSLKQAGAGYGLPKPYRLMRVSEVDGDPDLFEVTAIEINRLKFAAEDNAELTGEAIYSFPQKKEPARPTNVVARNMSRAAEDGTMIYTARIDFTKAADPYTTGYYLRYRLNGETEYTIIEIDGSGTTVDVPSAGLWEFQVQTRNIWSQQSPWVSTGTPLTLIDKIKAISGGRIASVEGSVNQIKIEVEYPTDQPDLRYAVIYAHDTDTNGLAIEIAKMDSTTFHHTGLGGVVSYYYWVKFEDNIGNRGDFTSPAGVKGTTTLLDGADIEDGTLTSQKFEVGFDPVQSVNELPTTNLYTGRVVLLRTNNTLYEFNGTQWVAMTGNLAEAAGIEAVNTLPTDLGPADHGKVVLLKTDNKIYRWTGTAWTKDNDAADIVGQIVASQIADATLTNEKFSLGLRAPGVGDTLPTLPNTNWQEGDMFVLTTNGHTYTLRSGAWSDSITAGQILGQIVETQISAGSITTPKLATGAVTTAKLSVVPFNINPDYGFAEGIAGWSNDNSVWSIQGSWEGNAASLMGVPRTVVVQGGSSTIPSGQQRVLTSPFISNSIQGGTRYRVRFPVYNSSNRQVRFGIHFYRRGESGDQYLSSEWFDTSPYTNTNHDRQIQAPPTANAYHAQWVVSAGPGGAFPANDWVAFGGYVFSEAAGATAIIDGSIIAEKLSAGSVTTGKIAAGAVTTNTLAAQSVVASKLLITPNNFNPDAGYFDSSFWYMPINTTRDNFWIEDPNGDALNNGFNNRHAALWSGIWSGPEGREVYSAELPRGTIKNGSVVRLRVRIQNSSNRQVMALLHFYDRNGAWITQCQCIAESGTLGDIVSNPVTVPVAAVTSRFVIYMPAGVPFDGAIRIGQMYATEMASADLIVDGAITADKILANSITTSKLATGAVTADKVAANAITAGKISVSDLAAISVNAGTITAGLLRNSAGTMQVDLNNSRIVFNNGTTMKVTGNGFGTSNQFIEWSGPSMAVNLCSESNAVSYLRVDGRAYFGGSILSGALSNSARGSNTSVPVSATLGPFGSNGGPITIVWSYDYSRRGQRWGNQQGGITGSTSALIRLYRRVNNGAESLVDTMSVSGEINVTYEGERHPSQPPGTIGQTFFDEYMGQSRTFTETGFGAGTRTYRIEVASRTVRSVPGDSNAADSVGQGYGVTSSE